MFYGAVPAPVVDQAFACVPFEEWPEIYVCCSGSFRWERALRKRLPQTRIVGNDVSFFTSAVGGLTAGEPPEFRFTERLAVLEDQLVGATPVRRVAYLMVAHELARHRGASLHAKETFAYYMANMARLADDAERKLTALAAELGNYGFFAGDFREHARHAAADGAGIVAAPPILKGDYEAIYKFITQNSDWQPPAYDLWDPALLPQWLAEITAAGAPYCVVTYWPVEGFEPVCRYDHLLRPRRSLYLFTNAARQTSYRGRVTKALPFAYQPVDFDRLGPKTAVRIVEAAAEHVNFLKDIYLQRGIVHTDGLYQYFVYLDDMLAGALVYAPSKFALNREIYLLSDVATSRERRLSKLITTLATSRAVLGDIERRLLIRIEAVVTTAFTANPVSMKYRGVFELSKRSPGQLQYRSAPRRESPDAIYREWYGRYARNPHPAGAGREARTPAGEPALHDLAAIRAADREHPARRDPDEPAADLRHRRRRSRQAGDPVGQPAG